MKIKYFLLGFLSLGCASCATTTIKSVKDSTLTPKSYTKVLVNIEGNIKDKSELESSVIKKLNSLTVTTFYSHIEMFPPIKEYSEKEITEKIALEGIEAILYSYLIDQKAQQQTSLIPVYHTTYGSVGGQKVRLNTSSMESYQMELATWIHRVGIFDIANKKNVWVADAETQGYDAQDMKYALISKSVRELAKSGFLLPRKSHP